MEDVLRQKNIVKLLLTKLSKYGNIPNVGFLCGGAVANTLMSMSWGGNYPINDLDIFIESKKNKVTNTPNRTDKLIISMEYSHLNASYNHGNNYKVISAERDGYLNVVKIFKDNRKESKDYMYILKGFDFNCTQVGIDLKTGELLYTPEFELFLKDRQLKVVAPYTPGHTAIRLFKKIDDLGCYCDIDGQMKLLSQPFNNEMMIRNTSSYTGVFGMYFSHKYKETYEHYKEQIKEYFQLVSLFEHKRWLWERRFILNNQQTKELDRDHVLSWLDPHRNPPQQYLDEWAEANGKIWSLIPVKYDKPDEGFVKVIDTGFSPLTLMGVWGMLYGGLKKSMVEKVKIIFKYNSLKELCLVNDYFYDCDFDVKGCELLNNAINNNNKLAQIIYKYNLNLQEGIELYKDVTKILNKEGRWFIELIYDILKENGNSFIKPGIEMITSLFEKEKEKLTKPLISGMDLSGLELPKGVEVKELISEYDLAYAGKKLSNCINNPNQGYKSKVKLNKSKIFVITTPKSMSALEIEMLSDTTFQEKYLLSYCNRTCNQYHRQIGDYLKSYIEKELILHSISKRLEKVEDKMKSLKGALNVKKDTITPNNKVNHNNLDFEDILVVNEEDHVSDFINVDYPFSASTGTMDFDFLFNEYVPDEVENIEEEGGRIIPLNDDVREMISELEENQRLQSYELELRRIVDRGRETDFPF